MRVKKTRVERSAQQKKQSISLRIEALVGYAYLRCAFFVVCLYIFWRVLIVKNVFVVEMPWSGHRLALFFFDVVGQMVCGPRSDLTVFWRRVVVCPRGETMGSPFSRFFCVVVLKKHDMISLIGEGRIKLGGGGGVASPGHFAFARIFTEF